MSDRKTPWKENETPVVGILRGYPLDVVDQLASIYLECGFRFLEITMNSPKITRTLKTITKKYKGLNIGAGTVCTRTDLDTAIDAGAQFIVTPVLDEDVISFCVENDIPVFPGAFTPTEIYTAWNLSATAVKVFPASHGGSRYIKEVLAPLNDIKLLPTGGVTADNIRSFFEAGATGVGMGSSLFDKKMIADKDWTALRNHFIRIKGLIPGH